MDTKNRFPNLNGHSSIEEWRQAKLVADSKSDPYAIAGCVGEPIVDALFELAPELLADRKSREKLADAIQEARENLINMVNDQRQYAWDECASAIEYLSPADCGEDIEANTHESLDEQLVRAMERGASCAYYHVYNESPSHVTEL